MAYYTTLGVNLDFIGGATTGQSLLSAITTNQWTNGLPGVLEIGELAFNGAGGSYDQIEVTCLADTAHKYTDGLIADADSSSNAIAIKFLYDPALFEAIKSVMDAEKTPAKDELGNRVYNVWRVNIPSGGCFELSADISSLALDSVANNDKLTFTMGLAVNEIVFDAEGVE